MSEDDGMGRRIYGPGGLMEEKDNLAAITPAKTDATVAAETRDRMYSALAVVCEIMDEAKKAKIRVGFSLSPADAFGRHHVALLEILKEL